MTRAEQESAAHILCFLGLRVNAIILRHARKSKCKRCYFFPLFRARQYSETNATAATNMPIARMPIESIHEGANSLERCETYGRSG